MARMLQGPGTFAQPSQLKTKKIAPEQEVLSSTPQTQSPRDQAGLAPARQASQQQENGGVADTGAVRGVDLLGAMLDHMVSAQLKRAAAAAAQSQKSADEILLRPDQLLSGTVPDLVLNPQAAKPNPMSRDQVQKVLVNALQTNEAFLNAIYAQYLDRLKSTSMP